MRLNRRFLGIANDQGLADPTIGGGGVLSALSLYGLLYLAEDELRPVNVNVVGRKQRLRLYLENAVGLSLSLGRHKLPFTLLTNNKAEILSGLKDIGAVQSLDVQQIAFGRAVPKGIKFYSAHFKLDVFNYFGTLDCSRYVGILDLDMIAVGAIPQRFVNLVQQGTPAYYDISDQVTPSCGEKRILDDMRKVSSAAYEGRWSGGEAIFGSPAFFRQLSAEVDRIFPNYVAAAHELHHQGDEMVTSVALEILRHQGVYMADLGTLGIVQRYWSVPCDHAQRPFRALRDCFLLHLPADKKFLAKISRNASLEPRKFFRQYQMHVGAFWAKGIGLRIRRLAQRIAS